MATSKIYRPLEALFPDFPRNPSIGFHNSIFRGINLGNEVTSEQWATIEEGTFDNLFIGDYWQINDIKWRIAAFDYWLHTGDTECTAHHIVIVPESNLINGTGTSTKLLNSSSSTAGGYTGTDFYTGNNSNTAKADCLTMIQSAFGSSHILNHREYLCDNATNGYEESGSWHDSTLELLSERMLLGNQILANRDKGTNVPMTATIDYTQLPLFMFARHFISNGHRYWLRDIVSKTQFSTVYNRGTISAQLSHDGWQGIRPVFGIC